MSDIEKNETEEEKRQRLLEEYKRKRKENNEKKRQRSRELKATNKKRHADSQAKSRKDAIEDSKKIVFDLAAMVKDSFWSQVKIADNSGLAPTTVTAIKRGKYKSARLSTIAGLARAMGYKLVLVPLEKDEDPYYEERYVRRADIDNLSKPGE